jgi:hypothetical protein
MPSAISLPLPAEEVAPCTDGGGGTTCAPVCPRLPCPPAARVPATRLLDAASSDGGGGTIALPLPPNVGAARCGETANCGAGAMTSDRPMFKSLSFRASASLIAGGGSTTEACGMFRARRAPALDASGAGATASTENEAIERLPASISGGGATTDRPMEDKSRLVDEYTSGAGATI